MEGFALTHKGCEEFAALEIAELLKTKCENADYSLVFKIKNEMELCKLCYLSQSITKAGLLLKKGRHNDFDSLANIDFSKYLSEEDSFRVACIKKENVDESTKEIEEKIGEIIINHIKEKKNYKQKVSLTNPSVIFLYFVANDAYHFGIDFAGIDLSKREYKIFTNPSSIKGTIAFSLLKFADYNKKESILDIMCGDGVLMIEAGLYAANFPVNFFQKERLAFNKIPFIKKEGIKTMFKKADGKIIKKELNITGLDDTLRNMKAARKNAKIAGISKYINFSKIDVDWLDIKIKEKSVNKILTQLPSVSKNLSETDIRKVYNEIFYQAEYILHKNGRAVFAARKKELALEVAEKYGFVLKKEKEVWTGEQPMYFFALIKE